MRVVVVASHSEPLTVLLEPALATADDLTSNKTRIELFCGGDTCLQRATWLEMHAVNVTSSCVATLEAGGLCSIAWGLADVRRRNVPVHAYLLAQDSCPTVL